MDKILIAVHGGASGDSEFLQDNRKEIERVLAEAVETGYERLEKGKTAVDAVEVAVKILEDHPYLNAGRGSALNCNGEVEMDASIMDGSNLDAGGVSMVQRVKNPISLARYIMDHTDHVILSGYGALEFAKKNGLQLEEINYFVTDHQLEELHNTLRKKTHGTVGAVALDKQGNVAAATSTGGITCSLPGRIGDSCHIGAGCYANNASCAVSGTGEGEFLIRGVVAHSIAVLVERKLPLQKACDQVIFQGKPQGEIGVISVNVQGDLGIAYNTEIMKRAWRGSEFDLEVRI